RQAEVGPVRVGQGTLQRGGACHAPVPLPRVGPFAGLLLRDAERAQIASPGFRTLPLLPAHLPRPAPEPLVEVTERALPIGQREVGRPSPREAVDGENALLHRDAPLARGELPQALLGPLRGPAINADLPLATAPVEAEPQEGPPPRPGHRGLVAVDLELEAALDAPRDALHHALPRALAADVDPSVVGVAHEAVPALV